MKETKSLGTGFKWFAFGRHALLRDLNVVQALEGL
jgi:hypothetical protein